MSQSDTSSDFEFTEPGYHDEDSDTWRKHACANEEEVYKIISPHHRILAFHGLADCGHYLVLQFHRNGNLWSYLLQNTPSLAIRIQWALEIAEGIAHLHSRSIVWADGHFGNILLTEGFNVVLADFDCSVIKPGRPHWFNTHPPPVFACPTGYYGSPPTHVDIFSFGIMLFALLMNRFPWTVNLAPNLDEQVQAATNHSNGKFDIVDAELSNCFGWILEGCFKAEYTTGAELLSEMKKACTHWFQTSPNPQSIVPISANIQASASLDMGADVHGKGRDGIAQTGAPVGGTLGGHTVAFPPEHELQSDTVNRRSILRTSEAKQR
ncbi:kinase-like domain-containing protein [Mycena vitilis]|nr:kinase-like domain-containing protein [Mycena vitilis]